MRSITPLEVTVVKAADIPRKKKRNATKWNLVCDRAKKLRGDYALRLKFAAAPEARQAACSIGQAIKRMNLRLVAASRGCDVFVTARQ